MEHLPAKRSATGYLAGRGVVVAPALMTMLRQARFFSMINAAMGAVAGAGYRRPKKTYMPNGAREIERRRCQQEAAKFVAAGATRFKRHLKSTGLRFPGATLRPENCGNIPTLAQRRALREVPR